jgi:hypothetical protein
LIGASPKIIIPPQSPAFFKLLFEVKTIGSVSKPSAIIEAL